MKRFELLVMHNITPCDPFQFAYKKKRYTEIGELFCSPLSPHPLRLKRVLCVICCYKTVIMDLMLSFHSCYYKNLKPLKTTICNWMWISL